MARNDMETAKQNFMACYAVFAKMGREDVKREVSGLLTVIDNREKSLELAARLKQIEGVPGSSSSASGSPNTNTMGYLLAGGDAAGALDYLPANALADAENDGDNSRAGAPLSAVNPHIQVGSPLKATYSPVDSKEKTRAAESFSRVSQAQDMQMRIDEQHGLFSRVPLQQAGRRNLPRKKF
jgi:hypothetical protein